MSLNVNKIVPEAPPSPPPPTAEGSGGASPVTAHTGGAQPRKVDRAKMNVRRGSKRLKQLFDLKPEADLDLDSFYQKRLRRRTQLQQEIASTLVSGGLVAGDGILNELASSPSMMRSMRITLSPGEEYENYKKVNAATAKGMLSPFISTPNQTHDDDDDDDDGSREAQCSAGSTAKLEHVTEETTEDLHRRESLAATAAVASAVEATGHTAGHSAGADGIAALPTVSPKLLAKRLHRMKSVSGHSRVVLHVSRMVNPLGRFRLAWDIVSICFIFYNAFAIPFDVSFNADASTDTHFDNLVDIFFFTDIVMTFNTAVEVDGSIRYDRRLAATNYLNSWFAVDLVAALPYGYIVPSSSDGGDTTSLVKSLKLLRLVRLLRLFRISRILRRIQNAVFIRSTLSSLLKYCMLVTFVSHWFSCAFHGIAEAHASSVNWIRAQGLSDDGDATKWDRYVAALYFAVQTLATIGFGDVSGTNADERLFSIFAMIVGGGIFAYGITNIVELVSSLTIQETRFRQKMDEVNEYMSARELPMKLRMEIREFYHNTRLSRESKLNSEQQILGDLSSKLRSKIALSINDQFLRKFPFFTGSDPSFLMELALNMRMIHFAPLEDVIIEGEIGHEMFFIFRGAVEVQRNGAQIGILGENQYFGEMAILSADNRRTASVRTLCFCELRMLSRNRFLEALAQYPAMQTKMAQVAKGRAMTSGNPQAVPLKDVKGAKVAAEVREASGTAIVAAVAASAPMMTSQPQQHLGQGQEQDQGQGQGQGSQEQPAPALTEGQLPPRSLNVSSSYSRLSMGSATTSALARIQQAERRISDPFVPTRAPPLTSSSRLNSQARRSASPNATGISPAMAHMITDITALLEEASRRQDLLMNRVVRLKNDLDQLVLAESLAQLPSRRSSSTASRASALV